jgi:hypothetical protein
MNKYILLIFVTLVSCAKQKVPLEIMRDQSCPKTNSKMPAVLELKIALKEYLPENIEVLYWDELIYSDCKDVPQDPPERERFVHDKTQKIVLAREFYDDVIPPKSFKIKINDLGDCVNKGLGEEIFSYRLNNIKYKKNKPYGNSCPQTQEKFSKKIKQ